MNIEKEVKELQKLFKDELGEKFSNYEYKIFAEIAVEGGYKYGKCFNKEHVDIPEPCRHEALDENKLDQFITRIPFYDANTKYRHPFTIAKAICSHFKPSEAVRVPSDLIEALRQTNMALEILESKYNLSGLTSSIDYGKEIYEKYR